MFAFLQLLGTFVASLFRPRRRLEVENLFLRHQLNIALRGAPHQTAFVIFVDGADEEDSLDVLYAGARAILPRTAKPDEIVTAIKAVTNGLAVLPSELLPMLLSGASLVGELLDDNDADRARLTPRELEVLAAMADGVSNKAIARRLGISFHTAKFHVATILAKLNADSRTEAVARAAQLGLVML